MIARCEKVAEDIAMFRSRRTEEQTPQIITFEGAVGSSGPDSEVVAVHFDNFDRDIPGTTRLAEIQVRDAYGNAEKNGYGNMYIGTASENAVGGLLTLTHDQRVGIRTTQPNCVLDVRGDTCISGSLRVNGELVGTDTPNIDVSAQHAIPIPILIDAETVKNKVSRVASFLWSPKAGSGPASLYIRGATRGKASKPLVWTCVVDLDRNLRIGVASVSIPDSNPRTIEIDLTPVSHDGATTPYPIEVLAWAEDRFTVECLAVSG